MLLATQMMPGQDECLRAPGAALPARDLPQPRLSGQRRGRAEAAQRVDGAIQQAGEAGVQ